MSDSADQPCATLSFTLEMRIPADLIREFLSGGSSPSSNERLSTTFDRGVESVTMRGLAPDGRELFCHTRPVVTVNISVDDFTIHTGPRELAIQLASLMLIEN